MLLHELKKIQLQETQEHLMLMTHDSIGENALHEHFIAERWCWVWMECYSSPLSIEKQKMLAFKYEFSLNPWGWMLGFMGKYSDEVEY